MDGRGTFQLPSWLRDGLLSEEKDVLLNKRNETRHHWAATVHARFLNNPALKPLTVKTTTVGDGGLGLLFRQQVGTGTQLELTPAFEDGEPVRVKVVHCTHTVQGYKVGCVIETT